MFMSYNKENVLVSKHLTAYSLFKLMIKMTTFILC